MSFNYAFKNPELLAQALTHKSFWNENAGTGAHNEVFEFLGDAVLDLALSKLLFDLFPTDDEGRLSRKRASLVNELYLSELARELGLTEQLRVGRGEKASGVPFRPRILASTLEALIGAVYLDSDYVQAEAFVRDLFEEKVKLKNWDVDYVLDYKTRLQELVQAQFGQVPQYQLIHESGPDHAKEFQVDVLIKGESRGMGFGSSKRAAEQDAAKDALSRMNQGDSSDEAT